MIAIVVLLAVLVAVAVLGLVAACCAAWRQGSM